MQTNLPAGFEVNVQVVREWNAPTTECMSPEQMLTYWTQHVATSPAFDPLKEHAVIVALNPHMRVICHNIVTVGSLTECSAAPREIFRVLCTVGAHSFVFAHNHPPGAGAEPSKPDKSNAQMLFKAGQLMGIPLIDACVICDNQITSLRAEGVFNDEIFKAQMAELKREFGGIFRN